MKKILKSNLLALPAFVLVFGVVASPIVYARDGSSDSTNTTTETSGGGTSGSSTAPKTETNTTTASEPKSNTETEAKPELKVEAQNEIKTEASDMLEKLRKDNKQHNESDREKNCKAAEGGLETRLQSLGKNADRFQARIDNIFTLAVAYQKDNNVQVANWSDLVAKATAAQAQAASSVSVLKALSPNLDCTQSTVASNVATFKVAAAKAQTDLQAYKTAVKNILVALEAAKQGSAN